MNKEHEFSQWTNGFKASPLLQEKVLYAGQLDAYERSSEILRMLGGISVSDSTIQRMVNHYGQKIALDIYEKEPQARGSEEMTDPAPREEEVVYVQMDGSMIFTDDDWQEVKVGRVFRSSDCRRNSNEERGGWIERSEYAAYMGNYGQFTTRFEHLIKRHKARGAQLVFITDGALWMRNWIGEQYPKALQILDFYHVCEHLGEFSKTAASQLDQPAGQWFECQKTDLLEGRARQVIRRVGKLNLPEGKEACEKRTKLLTYLKDNSYRMDYKKYRDRGLMIGSGAIEAAHRTLVQRRMKQSGQRWSNDGANHLLNLRVCFMSNKWPLLIEHIQNKKAA